MSRTRLFKRPEPVTGTGRFCLHTFALRLIVSVVAVLATVQTAQTQAWATRDVCTVTEPRIDPSQISPDLLQALRREAQSVPNSEGNFWRVTSPNEAVSYLWGTYYGTDPLTSALPQEVEMAARSARLVTLEIESTFASRSAVDKAMEQALEMNPMGDTLDQLQVEPMIQDWIDERLIALMLGTDTGNWLTPSNLLTYINWDPCNDFTQYTYPVQANLIAALAANQGADVVGLQSYDWYASKVDNPDNLALASAVVRQAAGTLLNPKLSEAELATHFALYLQGENTVTDLWNQTLLQSIFGADTGIAVQGLTSRLVVTDYVTSILPRLTEELELGNVFAVFGSYILPDQTGIVAQLQDAGFTVERLPLDRELMSQ